MREKYCLLVVEAGLNYVPPPLIKKLRINGKKE
jgi:protein-L-isoaspartate O-methyltransferase